MENWYTEKELITWLKKNKYSDLIACELSPMLVKAFNSAFRKGFEKGVQKTIIKIIDQEPEINKEVLLFVADKNGKVSKTLGFRSGDKKDPEFNNGYIMDWHIDGKVIAYSLLPDEIIF